VEAEQKQLKKKEKYLELAAVIHKHKHKCGRQYRKLYTPVLEYGFSPIPAMNQLAVSLQNSTISTPMAVNANIIPKRTGACNQGCDVGGKITDSRLCKISDCRLRLSKKSDSDLSKISDSKGMKFDC